MIAKKAAATNARRGGPPVPRMRASPSIRIFTKKAGATPKVRASASESSCLPKSLMLSVRRATLPSSASATIPRKISMQAVSSFL